jgi:hypothetical protein
LYARAPPRFLPAGRFALRDSLWPSARDGPTVARLPCPVAVGATPWRDAGGMMHPREVEAWNTRHPIGTLVEVQRANGRTYVARTKRVHCGLVSDPIKSDQ